MAKKRILTGYRPTGKLHLGHWFGNLQNMLQLQHEYDAFYFIADWHALTSDWQHPENIQQFTEEMVLDWCAAGLDPEIATIYRQSDVPEVAELMLYFTMVLPMPWLERVPSYKEQRAQITEKDLGNVGFFLYPALQAADIAIVLADFVPVGEDQLPHLELTREIVRRFNSAYGDFLVEPQAIIAKEGARVPGTDGRKMSKSYGNSIFISDEPDEIRKKVMSCLTDPARKLKTDPGDPDICPLHQIHKLIGDPDVIEEFDRCCRVADCGCVAHKKKFAEDLLGYLGPFQERRRELAAKPGFAAEVLAAGASKVRPVTDDVVGTCRELLRLDPATALSANIEKRTADTEHLPESHPGFVDVSDATASGSADADDAASVDTVL
ncbi:MAG: tryptophan--tRNA ligase [Coriobacteriales bacterium]|nr:tryptophan--tRNA ligase [Coriobacteriales bacterium]